jgi:dihydrofolate reductase
MKIIVATDEMGGIAKDGQIPWKCKVDMDFFRMMTIGSTVVMGSKTFDSLPKELPFRNHIIITRNPEKYPTHKCMRLGDFYNFSPEGETWVVGGEFIYEAVIHDRRITQIYQSVISGNYECDKFFPQIPNWFYQNRQFKLSNDCVVNKFFKMG